MSSPLERSGLADVFEQWDSTGLPPGTGVIHHQIKEIFGAAKPRNSDLTTEKATIDRVYVGNDRTNRHLMGIVSVVKEWEYLPLLMEHEIRFKMLLNGELLATKVFASDREGRVGRLIRDSSVTLGDMTTREYKK